MPVPHCRDVGVGLSLVHLLSLHWAAISHRFTDFLYEPAVEEPTKICGIYVYQTLQDGGANRPG